MLQTMRNFAKYIWIFIVLAFVVVFIFYEQSGLTSRPLTRGTTVGSVNGQPITYDTWIRTLQERRQAIQQRQDRPMTLDDERQLEEETFEGLVTEMLLAQEYRRRGISVSDDEIVQAAQYLPHPQFMQSPEFQTEGRFDPEKYQRFLRSPVARQQGLLRFLEDYYRAELPKEKLFQSVASTVYVTDPQLWWLWQLRNDSARVSYVRFDPADLPDSAVRVTDEEIQRRYRESEKKLSERPGRAVVSLTFIPRVISAADTAAARERLVALRNEIAGGAKFEDVARRESADTVSAAQGGSLGSVTKGRFVSEFEQAAFALKPGELSAPVLSPFGYHLIKVDERKGDTVAVRHILLRIQQSDSAAQRTDRLADELSRLAATTEDPRKFDSAVKKLQLPVSRVSVTEGEPLDLNGRYVPSVSAWAFSGGKVGETSDLIDAEEAYYLARLDSLEAGGKATLAAAREGIHDELVREKKIDRLADSARKLSQAVAQGKTLEVAAKALGDSVVTSPMFTRAMPVPQLGQLNEVIGAAFGLPVGAVSEPIRTEDGVYVIRVDKRAPADRAAWEKQKQAQREQMAQALRQQRVRDFMIGLRESAKIEDNRKEIDQRARTQQG